MQRIPITLASIKRLSIIILFQLQYYSYRYDTSVPVETYQVKQARTLATIVKCVNSNTNYGVIHKPLIHIDLQQVSYIYIAANRPRKHVKLLAL